MQASTQRPHRTAILLALGASGALRLLYALLGWLSRSFPVVQVIHTPLYESGRALLQNTALMHWFQWDAGWYLNIAAFGYGAQTGSTAFAPLYPLIWRSVTYICGCDYLVSAAALGFVFTTLAIWFWYETACLWLDDHHAKAGLLAWITFPTFFFLFAPYSEGLYLALTGAFWWAALKKRWGWAALLAALATLARFQGVVLSAVLLWHLLFPQANKLSALLHVQPRLGWRLLWAGLPWLAFGSWTFWLHLHHLDTPTQALYQFWGITSVPPWRGFLAFAQRLLTQGPIIITDWLDLYVLILTLIALIYAFKFLPASANIYVWGVLALIFTRGITPHLMDSYSRYALGLTPLFFLSGQQPKVLRYGSYLLGFLLQIILLIAFFKGAWVA